MTPQYRSLDLYDIALVARFLLKQYLGSGKRTGA
jgi:hypothetical protein